MRRAGATLQQVQAEAHDLSQTRHPVQYLHVDSLTPWREQPRREFDEASLAAFTQEILDHGVNHALLIRAVGDQRIIIAGERRWQVSKLAGQKNPNRLFVPCVVREMTDTEAHTVAIMENVQREDLNPYEFAAAVARLCTLTLKITQDELIRRLTQAYNRRDAEAAETVTLAGVLGRMGSKYARLTWKSYVVNYLPMLRYPAHLSAALQRGVAYTKVALLLKLKTETQQRQALEEIESQGLSLEESRRVIASMLQTGQPTLSQDVKQTLTQVRAVTRRLTAQRWAALTPEAQRRALALTAELQTLLDN
ncbi:ParB/RepB/Spo0J family partition protein (plasmid) [Deinococcus sp. KNUC1210]|uniref:ParB/RepB/Spo0J family partition protein n=1 Tax=Deinococcus sp. KNUC1210 TaxID=2917691 RepID=UPI001EF078D5|nr:ParB/RepB/Spo0J family partition protein [Deinococcus sp. KNUC1210]ULH17513.1 ParB/RepB/Spo0J family partition protein [Deinococcus sp. KNUC1210]